MVVAFPPHPHHLAVQAQQLESALRERDEAQQKLQDRAVSLAVSLQAG